MRMLACQPKARLVLSAPTPGWILTTWCWGPMCWCTRDEQNWLEHNEPRLAAAAEMNSPVLFCWRAKRWVPLQPTPTTPHPQSNLRKHQHRVRGWVVVVGLLGHEQHLYEQHMYICTTVSCPHIVLETAGHKCGCPVRDLTERTDPAGPSGTHAHWPCACHHPAYIEQNTGIMQPDCQQAPKRHATVASSDSSPYARGGDHCFPKLVYGVSDGQVPSCATVPPARPPPTTHTTHKPHRMQRTTQTQSTHKTCICDHHCTLPRTRHRNCITK